MRPFGVVAILMAKYNAKEPVAISLTVAAVLPILAAAWVVLAIVDGGPAVWLVQEDGPIQWLQFFCLISSSFICLLLRKEPHRWFFVIFALLLFSAAMEEISWGRRIIGFQAPEWISQINTQHDSTLHNLKIFQRYRHWPLIGFGTFGIVLIQSARWRNHDETANQGWASLLPPSSFMTCCGIILYSGVLVEAAEWRLGAHAGSIRYWAGRFSEIGEFLADGCLFLYCLSRWLALSRKSAQDLRSSM
jgi:hypothetical protein